MKALGSHDVSHGVGNLWDQVYTPVAQDAYSSDWRRERDSNPRELAPQLFSRQSQSTTLPSLHRRFYREGAGWESKPTRKLPMSQNPGYGSGFNRESRDDRGGK